jgi:dTDP-4-amino-4,6-dideoxygalactose transaminase
MTCGEGGMVVTHDRDLADLLDYTLSKFGRIPGGHWYDHHRLATNATLTELQAAVLVAQLDRLEEQTERRARAGKRLINGLTTVQGIAPYLWGPGTDRHGYHLFVFSYDAGCFEGLTRASFVSALNAELGSDDLAAEMCPRVLYRASMFNCETGTVVGAPNRTFRAHDCPHSEEASRRAVMIHQRALLAEDDALDAIVEAIAKIHRYAGELVT